MRLKKVRRAKKYLLDADGQIVVDAYGFEVLLNSKRHWKCSCPVPCQERYECAAPHHRGNRETPWCCGAADAQLTWCDHCVMRWHQNTPKGPQAA